MTLFSEIADRIWVARLPWWDVNVTVVGGDDGLLVVDTAASDAQAREVLEGVRQLGGPVRWAVNTHVHFDHTLGNGVFADEGAEIVAHEAVAATLAEHTADVRAQAVEDLRAPGADPRLEGLVATEPVAPHRTFSSVAVLDLGGRTVEVVHPGRGHTSSDCVLRIADADVLLAGDLVEEAGEGVPGFGTDCWPLEWPLTLDVVLQLTGPSTVVVPGHGSVVDRDFVEDQRARVGVVAEMIRDLAARGVPAEQALEAGEDWPFAPEHLAEAVRRAYDHLPRNQKRLPLL